MTIFNSNLLNYQRVVWMPNPPPNPIPGAWSRTSASSGPCSASRSSSSWVCCHQSLSKAARPAPFLHGMGCANWMRWGGANGFCIHICIYIYIHHIQSICKKIKHIHTWCSMGWWGWLSNTFPMRTGDFPLMGYSGWAGRIRLDTQEHPKR